MPTSRQIIDVGDCRVYKHSYSRLWSEFLFSNTRPQATSHAKGITVKRVSLISAVLLISNNFAFATQAPPPAGPAQAQTQETLQATKAKAEVAKRGTGEKSRVRVELLNGTEAKGYINKVEDTSFEVTDTKTRQTTTIPYAEVKKIQGFGLSKGAKIGIVVAVVAVVVAAVVAIKVSTAGVGPL
jgi:predicted extracellular nuclease